MTLHQILSLCFGSGIIVTIFTRVWQKIKANENKTESVQLGVQALLRDRLYQSYLHYQEKGYAPIYAKENFENMYNKYHNLGVNGVMDDIYRKFMDFPTDKDDEH